MRFLLGFLLAWVGLSACMPILYDPITQTQLARQDMRVVRQDDLTIYYGDGDEAAVARIAGRLRQCLTALRAKRVPDASPREPIAVVMADSEMNNAYVQAAFVGHPLRMVVPLHESLAAFDILNQGVGNTDDIACHEAVHAVLNQESYGFWQGINTVFGNVFAPGAALPDWFHEGVATYYESHLGRSVGRMHSPLWHGQFAALAADRDAFNVGRLNTLDRENHGMGSGPYMVGSHFVAFLVERYGEEALWKLVDKQAHSIFSLWGFSLRFEMVYGIDIGDAFAAFKASLDERYPARLRPATQTLWRANVGTRARLAVANGAGDVALVQEDLDAVTRLTLLGEDGDVRWTRRAVDILPGREQIAGGVMLVSGLSFDSDASHLFATVSDVAYDPGFRVRVVKIDARSGERIAHWAVRGVGGDVTGDGRYYVYVRMERDKSCLAMLNLEDGTSEDVEMSGLPTGVTSVATPSFSPDGRRIAFAGRSAQGFDLFVRGADGTVAQLTDDGAFNYTPRWRDDNTLVFVGGAGGVGSAARLQAHSYEVDVGVRHSLTDAPYVVLDAAPWTRGRTLFLSAEGHSWNVEYTEGAEVAQVRSGADPVRLRSAPSDVTVAAQIAAAPDDDTAAAAEQCWADPEPFDVFDSAAYEALYNPVRPAFFGPSLSFTNEPKNMFLADASLDIAGQDRLAYHSYFLRAGDQFQHDKPRAELTYINAQLAPWTLRATAKWDENLQLVARPERGVRDRSIVLDLRDRILQFSAERTMWSTALALGLRVHDVDYTGFPAAQTYLGPSLAVNYGAGELTPYGADSLALRAGGFVWPLLDEAQITTTAGAHLAVLVPLPVSKRHTLRLETFGARTWGRPRGWRVCSCVSVSSTPRATATRIGSAVPLRCAATTI